MGAISFSLDENLLKFFLSQTTARTFIETGTYQGDTVEMASRHFKECHSVELSPELHAKAAARFKGRPEISVHLGQSPLILKKLCQQHAASPLLFWLDAHWCSAESTAGHNSQSPLLDEIRAIERLHEDSVILIDDARLYLCPPGAPHRYNDWPDFHDIVKALLNLSETHRIVVFNDVIVFYPARVQAAFQLHMNQGGVDWLTICSQSAKYLARKKKWRNLLKPFSK